jgi:hypothetical protein
MVARIRADRACAAVNWILLAASLGIGFYFGNGLRVLVAGLPLAIASTVMAFAMPGHLTTRLVSAITFMGSAALMIDAGHGTSFTSCCSSCFRCSSLTATFGSFSWPLRLRPYTNWPSTISRSGAGA